MPFPKWSVDPVYLSRRAIPPDKGITNDLECTANLTLVAALRQLADLVKIADVVFSELGTECGRLVERSERIAARTQTLANVIDKLDAKKVLVRKCPL
ncbi:hypothetical protein BIW11_00930 [Tropilaelaps mercedesae]|uniref:Wiskott-Aldrich syndrome protein family member 3-like n=1 Tax=Tropilaelaps mercedesae TaxID=418985 RepID=A0A1V9XM95_9ACAR|nr:hypothetical protein BIW11_00930 [Tropilaelaps mercedesae]